MTQDSNTIDAKRRKVLLGMAAGATYATPALLSFAMGPAHASGLDGLVVVVSNTVTETNNVTRLDGQQPTQEELLRELSKQNNAPTGALTGMALVSGNAESLYAAQGGALAKLDLASGSLRKVAVQPPRGASDVAVSDITAFVVGSDGTMWKVALSDLQANRGKWQQMGGAASRIFVSPKYGNNQRDVWHLSKAKVSVGGHNMYRSNGGGWVQVPGQATEIAFEGANQAVWHANSVGRMYRATVNGGVPQGWQQVPGEASQLVSSDSGVVWHLSRATDVNGDHYAFARAGSGWRRQPNFAARRILPAGNGRRIWALKNSGVLKPVSV